MKGYKNILVAVELNAKTDAEPIKRAEYIAKESDAKITLVHAIEYAVGYSAYGIGINLEIEEILVKSSSKAMMELGKQTGVPENKRIVKVGPAKYVILEEAEKIKADLIIVGSHGWHGIRALLGSTADGVLHGAKCDVLAIRLKE
jgi:universal stress protein A